MRLLLDYVRALVWPVVAAFGLGYFRHPIAQLFKDRRIDKVKAGPAGLEAGFVPADQEEAGDQLDELLQAWGPVINDPGALDDGTEEDAATAAWREDALQVRGELHQLGITAKLLALLNTIFQEQIDFLKLLRDAPDGLVRQAALDWYAELGERDAAFATWPFEDFMDYLRREALVEIDANGLYRISEGGRHFLEFEQAFWYAEKAH
jgi:hypothetical protein